MPTLSIPRKGYNNCYYGPGVDKRLPAVEPDSVIGDPLFADSGRQDYRVRWDSPAAYLAEYARTAGAAEEFVRRTVRIEDVGVAGQEGRDAVLTWATPWDDCWASVRYRQKGTGPWLEERSPDSGTRFAAVVQNFQPGVEYEFFVEATSRRNCKGNSAVAIFRAGAARSGARTLHLAADGNDDNDGLTPQTSWRSLRKACICARSGDTVLFAPGCYPGVLTPLASGTSEQRIVFKSDRAGEAAIDGENIEAPLVVPTGKDYITLDGLKFVRVQPGAMRGTIKLHRSKGVEILNCRSDQHTDYQSGYRMGKRIEATECLGLCVERNVFWGGSYQVDVSGCPGIVVRNNTFLHSSLIAVRIWTSSNIRIVNNIFYDCSDGTHPDPAVGLFNVDTTGLVCDYNLYFLPIENPANRMVGAIWEVKGGARRVVAGGDGLEAWQRSSGFDLHSIQADPMFVDIKQSDFRLKAGSPAIGRGDRGDIGALGSTK